MIAHVWFTAAALAAAPVPTSPGDGALDLYDRGEFLAAAEAAIGGYLSPAVPAAERLQSARLAQEALAQAYAAATTTQARPEYLCRALDVLDATAPLAVTAEDVRLHSVFATRHRATLAREHPGHTCEAGTELRPIVASSPVRAPAPVVVREPSPAEPSLPSLTDRPRQTPAPASLKIAGAVSLSLGIAALAVMAGGLGIRSQAQKAAQPLVDAKMQQAGSLTVEQVGALVPLSAADAMGRQLTLAGGISGAALLVIGAALVARGHVLARARVSPLVGRGQAGIVIHGRF